MGSDTSPEELAQALVQLRQEKFPAELVPFTSVDSDTITVADDPALAIRRKKESSLYKGLLALSQSSIDAFVSAGNTGALLLAAKTILKTIPGIDRPALLTPLPTQKNELAVLDVGANLSLKSGHIVQFAAMGIAYQKSRGIPHPTVGLLNVGVEAIKGTPQAREAYAKLQALNNGGRKVFLGNIEGKDAFAGNIDVLVTDGFTGNVFLKTAEGLASFILHELEKDMSHDIAALRRRLYTTEHPGAILCGVDGLVIKCHGHVTVATFMTSIKGAYRLLQSRFLEQLANVQSELRQP